MLPQHLQLSSSPSNPYLIEQLQFMLHQESTPHYQTQSDYFATNKKAKVTSSDRRTMATWSYDIVDACSIDREVACIATTYCDRCMSTSSKRAKDGITSRRRYQLAFIACLIIALKCRAGMTVDSDFVSDILCQRLYDKDEILDMEKEILSGLEWRLNEPSVHEFIAGLVELLPRESVAKDEAGDVIDRLKTMANVQAEMILLDYDMGRQKPSLIGYAAILSSLQCISTRELNHLDRLTWMQRIRLVTGMKSNNVFVCALKDQMMQVVQRDLLQAPTSTSGPAIEEEEDEDTRRTKHDRMQCSTVVSASSIDCPEGDDSERQLLLDCSSFSMDDSTSSLESFSDMTI